MQNPNTYNRQPSNFYQPQPSNYPNQMSNFQPPQGGQQPPYGQMQPGQMSQPPFGQPPYGQPSQFNPPGQMSQQPYGQPPYGPPPSYGPPGGMNDPAQNSNQTDIPYFQLSGRGKGIDSNEYYVITHAAADSLNAKEDPLSNGIIKRIKKSIGGEWMVFASVEGLKGYDFSLSIVQGNDFLSFTIQNFRFQVCRLRD